MILTLLLLFTFLVGASLTRLVTTDSLFEGIRDRWTVHFVWRQDQVLNEVNSRFQILEGAVAAMLSAQAQAGLVRRRDEVTRADRRIALMQEIGERSEEEPPAPWWLRGKPRRELRCWSWYAARLVRIRGYQDFIGCPWCVGFWVFLAVGLLMWGRLFAFGPVSAETLDWGAWEVWLFGGALAARWVYAVTASALDRH